MEINNRNIDIDLAIHSIALEYAKMLLQIRLNESADTQDEPGNRLDLRDTPLDCLDLMYSEYLRAVGHLSQKGDDYVMSQLEDC